MATVCHSVLRDWVAGFCYLSGDPLNTIVTLTLASTNTHLIWSLSGCPYDTVRFGYARTNRNPLSAALAEALHAIPIRSFLAATYGKNYSPDTLLPVTVIAATKDFPPTECGLDRKLGEFDITWQIVSPDDERITELQQWQQAGQ